MQKSDHDTQRWNDQHNNRQRNADVDGPLNDSAHRVVQRRTAIMRGGLRRCIDIQVNGVRRHGVFSLLVEVQVAEWR